MPPWRPLPRPSWPRRRRGSPPRTRRRRDGLALRHEQGRMRELDGRRILRRNDHPHADLRLVEQVLGETIGHPDAAMRGGIARQRSAMQRDPVPGDALHVGHPGIVIHGRAMVLVLLDDGEDARRRLAARGAGRNRRAEDPAVGVVEGDLLALDRHDRHDRLAGLARRDRLGRLARLLGRLGARWQHRERDRSRQGEKRGKPPTPHRQGGLRRRHQVFHATPRFDASRSRAR